MNRNDCVGEGDVPCFNQVIVGSGNTDIGIHIDTALAEAAGCCGGKGRGKGGKGGGEKGEGGLDFVDMEDPQYQNCLDQGTVCFFIFLLFIIFIFYFCCIIVIVIFFFFNLWCFCCFCCYDWSFQ